MIRKYMYENKRFSQHQPQLRITSEDDVCFCVAAVGKITAAISLHYIGRKNSKMISVAVLLITGYLSFHVLANLGYVPPTNPLSIVQK